MRLHSLLVFAAATATAAAAPNINGGPSGDTCVDALTATTGGTAFDTSSLTDSGFHDASCVSRDGFTDIWFTYTAVASGDFTVDTCGADFDTVLRVLEGPDCSTLTCLVGNDDACATSAGTNFASSVDVPLTAGATYFIHVEGWSSSAIGAGTLTITPPPTGDTCAEALPAGAGANPFDTTTLTDSGFHDASCVSRDGFTDIWFTYTAVASGDFTVDTCGADFDTVLRVLEGPDCSTLTCLVGNDDACATSVGTNFASSVDVPLIAGTNYFIHVEGWDASEIGAATLTITEPSTATGDTCADPVVMDSFGAPNFINTATLTASGLPTNCGTMGKDKWFALTQFSPFGTVVTTCGGTSNDTVMEAYEFGPCGSLVQVACNDDSCGLQSLLRVNGQFGDVFLIRVGAFGGGEVNGNVFAFPQGPPDYCLGNPSAPNNSGSVGGAVFVDVTVTQPVQVSGYASHFNSAAGTPVGQTVYVNTLGATYQGFEQDPSAWAPIGTSSSISVGFDFATPMRLDQPILLPAGTFGICLVNDGGGAHAYTNGTGSNETWTSVDGVISFTGGAGQNTPFTGTPFSPRVWNGGFCYDQVNIGTNYCAANANSTGSSASMSATGSVVVGLDTLVLQTDNLPAGSVGYYLASMDQGFSANPGGSAGNLCLGGTVGRGMGDQVYSTGSGTIVAPMGLDLPFNLTGRVAVNETWNFQLWFRDIDNAGGSSSNFSDGYSILFQ